MSATACRLVLFVLLVCACASPPGAQATPGQRHEDNVATAVVQDDGGRAFDFAFEVLTTRADVVDNFNAANAGARCTGCRATAIAFQVVLVSGLPDRLTPHNRAVAVNDSCTECVVTAEARQFVRVVDEPVKFTDEGRAILADVRGQLAALRDQDLSLAEIHAAVEAQEARVSSVLADEVVPKADEGSEEPDVLSRRLLQDSDG
jgi:putative peptide zinc metalloprotease protein